MAQEGSDRFFKYREEIIRALILTVPLGILVSQLNRLKDSALDTPWVVLWIGVPLILLIFVLRAFLKRDHTPLRHWRWTALLVAFSGLFAVLASTDALRWSTLAQADAKIGGRDWMLPLRVADWHYWFARRSASPDVLRVLLLDQPAENPVETLRQQQTELIELASGFPKEDAPLGMAFDVFYVATSPADTALCAAIDGAQFQVFSGYTAHRDQGELLKYPEKPPLPCQKRDRQGHLLAYADLDGRVRALRMWFDDTRNDPAFSWKIAQEIAARAKLAQPLKPPSDNVLRFLPPKEPLHTITLEQLRSTPGRLQRKYLLVGIRTDSDRYPTPFGTLPGTMSQAYAIHSLLTNNYIIRPSPLWSAALIFVGCFMLMLCVIQQRTTRFVLATSALLTVLVLVLAAASMYLWRAWLEVIYPVVAFWLWTWILLIARRRLHPKATSTALSLSTP